MKLHVEIDIDNDAFFYEGELTDALIGVARLAEDTPGKTGMMPMRDSNGNTVGNWWISEE